MKGPATMWTPHELRKLIAQVAGLISGVAGVTLIIKGVQAAGHINISSSILSGQIESGSAGLFLVFLGFLLIIFPALSQGQTKALAAIIGDKKSSAVNSHARFGIATVGLALLSLALLFSGDYISNTLHYQSGNFLLFAGFSLGLIAGLMLIFFVFSWIEPASPPTTEKNEDETNV